MLSATVIVDAGSATAGATCQAVRTGQTIHLAVGQTAQLVANGRPTLDPPGSRAITVGTTPVHKGPAPGAPDGATGALVTITGAHPGTVTLHWINCTGTEC
jgi:hypothetical protein